MATLKVKFKAIGLRGEPIRFTQKIECPDFQEYESEISRFVDSKLIRDGIINSKVTIKEQQEEWLSDFDKWDMIVEKDIQSIIDWTIIRKKEKMKELTKIEKLKVILSRLFTDNQCILDFMVIYERMLPSMKGLSLDKQIQIVTASFNTALSAQITIADQFLEIARCRTSEQIIELREKRALKSIGTKSNKSM